MKVIIVIHDNSIVVPCGDGMLTVKKLIRLAVTGYKRVGKGLKRHINVDALKNSAGVYLDFNDRVVDVLQDGEKVIARLSRVRKNVEHTRSASFKRQFLTPGYYVEKVLPPCPRADKKAKELLPQLIDGRKDPRETDFVGVHPDRYVKFNPQHTVHQVIKWQCFVEKLLR